MPDPALPSVELPKPTQARRLALAFQAVFGQSGRNARSADQRLVLAHLRKICGVDGLCFQRADGYNPHSAAQRDGARAVIIAIEEQLTKARGALIDEEKPKPKSKR